MKTKSEAFVYERTSRWRALRSILLTIRKGSYKSLTDEQISEFPRLYRQLCTDLAEARMLKLSPDVLTYLNNLVGEAHLNLYSFPPITGAQVKHFFTSSLPRILIESRKYVIASAILFFLPLVISLVVTYRHPEYARFIMPGEVLEQMESSYQQEIDREGGIGTGAYASSYYIQHNTTIAFFSFAAGVLLGIGTVFFLIYNGIAIGTIAGYITGLGYGENFLNFVCGHSVMELTGLVIAGAAGLLLGFSIIKANKYNRRDWLKLQKERILTLLCPSVFLLACAALIEGNISPTNLPLGIKAFVALLSAGFLIYYFGIIPYLKWKEQSHNDEK
ncbi:MAG: stage II sporulation protein M [Spirochaetales bacterium]|nr:stage II sporulation protein M [Spirochaetales bacterium]